MTSISLVLCVLLFSSFLSSYAEFVTQDSAFPGVFGQTFWLSQEPPTICPTLGKPPRADLCLPCICPHPTPLQEQPVGDLLLALWLKTGLNWNVSAYMDTNMLQGLLSSWRATLNDVPKLTGKLAIRLWASALWQICSWTWYCIANHFWTVAIVVCLYLLTACMATMVRYLFGGLLGYLLRICGASVIKGVWSCYTRAKSSSSYVKEKAVKGFLSFRIPQKPPRSSVLLVQHNDDSHAGYATNVLLYNGEFCLLTAEHVWKTPGARVVSTQNGSKIPISEFQLLMSVDGGDLVVLRGPPNWTSVLQTKAVSFTTSARLERGKVTLYSYNGEWSATNGEVVGTEGIFATHLSNTTGGHSGTPLFHGKTVVGIHIGASNENWNLAAVIPAVAGLTSPDYVFETTAPQGKVFDEATVEMISERIKLAEYLINYKPKSGKAWADEDDDMFYDPESAPPNPLPQPVPSAPTLPSGATTPTGPANGLYPTIDVGAVPVLLGKRVRRRQPPKQGKTICHPTRARKRWEKRARASGQGAGEESFHQFYREGGCPTSGEQHQEATTSFPRAAPSETAKGFQEYFRALYCWEVPPSAPEVAGFQSCGSLPRFYHTKQKGRSPWGETLCLQYPELEKETRGFGWPQFGAEAELKSLQLQAARWLDRAQSAEIPSTERREHVIRKTVEAYASCRTNGPAATRGAQLSWPDFLEDFKLAVLSLELDAGVGVPYIGYGLPTHRGWVEDPNLLPVLTRLVFDRLQKMSEASFEDQTPEELVASGLCDPIRLFVKGEPHKQAKLDEGRYRLIMSVSLVDQLVARVLFQNQNKREIALWRAIPSKPGFGLSTDGQTREFLTLLADQMSTTLEDVVARWREFLVPTDCSGFDWSVADWMLADEMEVRNRLTVHNNALTRRLRACWLKCISNSVLCLSNGTLLAQRVAGVQKSGSYNTSSSNSRIRVMSAYHCGASWAMAMGDDALESVDTDLTVYKNLGFKVEVSGELEFCSHIFMSPDLAVPVNRAKMLYKLIHGYNPASGNLEVVSNYLNACFSVLNELRSDPDFVSLLYTWLVSPVLPQKNV
ncbi:RNA-dependent RNA polymerase [Cotton bunchy top virus 1]|nr:RNA-dependent RNA polymerase [Cotton bunchy top virus 1]